MCFKRFCTIHRIQKREKHPWRRATLIKLLAKARKLRLFLGVFLRSSNCTNVIKLRKVPQIFLTHGSVSFYFCGISTSYIQYILSYLCFNCNHKNVVQDFV